MLFWRPRATITSCGSSGDFAGDYSFSDTFTGDLWTPADTSGVIALGNYYASNSSGAKVLLDSTFASTNSAGDWSLDLFDGVSGTAGSFSSWTLTLGR